MSRLTSEQIAQLPPYVFEVQKTGDFYYSSNDPETLYLSRSGLKRSGWTEKLIDAILAKADARAENPHDERCKSMALYSLARIQRLQQHPVMIDSLDNRVSKRSAKRQKQAAQQVVQLQQLGLPLELPEPQQAIGDLARDF